MGMRELKPGRSVWRFDQMAVNVNDRIDDPSKAGVDRYVGLEHLDPESLKIRRWGSPSDVEATKLVFRKGDIIFGRRRAYQRKLAVADFDGICSAHAMVLRAKPDVVLPEFLPFFMQSDLFMNRAVEISVGSLSPTINWKTLAQQEFELPPVEEQRRLVEALLAIDKTIFSFDNLLGICKATLSAASADLTQMRWMNEQNLAEDNLPAEWKFKQIGDLCTLSGGYGFRPQDWSSQGLPIIRIQNLNGSSDFNYYAGEPLPEWLVEPGELLFAWAGMPGVSFGPCIWPGPTGLLNQHIYRVLPVPEVSKMWLYHVLKLLTPWIERRAHGFKTTLLHIRRAELTERVVPVPPLDVQERIVALLDQFDLAVKQSEARLAGLRQLKQSIFNTNLTIAATSH